MSTAAAALLTPSSTFSFTVDDTAFVRGTPVTLPAGASDGFSSSGHGFAVPVAVVLDVSEAV